MVLIEQAKSHLNLNVNSLALGIEFVQAQNWLVL